MRDSRGISDDWYGVMNERHSFLKNASNRLSVCMAKYSKGAQKSVKSAMRRKKKGTLRSGRSEKKVTSRKQAIAIGLSEARKKGAKVPAPKRGTKAAKRTGRPAKKGSSASRKRSKKKAAAKN